MPSPGSPGVAAPPGGRPARIGRAKDPTRLDLAEIKRIPPRPSRLTLLYVEIGRHVRMTLDVLASRFHARAHQEAVRNVWRNHRWEAIGVAILAPASYILILTAMSFTPLSSVAPAREISILIGAVLGSRFLGEQHTRRRLVAASAMVCGVIALALG